VAKMARRREEGADEAVTAEGSDVAVRAEGSGEAVNGRDEEVA
jgi:hypothetical protein